MRHEHERFYIGYFKIKATICQLYNTTTKRKGETFSLKGQYFFIKFMLNSAINCVKLDVTFTLYLQKCDFVITT